MKLLDAVLIGRFCGLETVEECVLNIEMRVMNLFVYDQINKELIELHQEHSAYLAGDLTLDWNFIDADVAKQHEEMMKSDYGRLAERPNASGC